jgi:hypothetical protein
MSNDAQQPSVAEVREAAEAVKAAIDAHLTAVENRVGESDPAVYAAYEALAAAADAYDEVLYDTHDEVTPFEVVTDGKDPAPSEGDEEPEAISVLIRRDYLVAEPERLISQAARVAAADGAAVDGDGPPDTIHAALEVLFGEYEPDEIASRCEEYGLEDGDATLWVTAVDPSDAGEWLGEPFDDIDGSRLISRFDVSSVYEDDLEDLEDLEGIEEEPEPQGHGR